ncbi:MAG: DUF1294 domain-containing protein [Lachnospiraceae bacterium]|nr:DUF1294 domain-containing protein [Lachnospiraceae bacterium]
MEALKILIIYLLVINVLSFICFGVDKSRARRSRWRISEGSLFSLAIFGGSLGALLGMYVFRHKTQKLKFKAGMPLILFFQLAILAMILIFRPFDLSFM